MVPELKKCLTTLEAGGTILYPTDTVWGIGCDATNEIAVKKIYRLKKRMETKSLIILLADQDKLHDYVPKVPDLAWELLDIADSPLTIIYPDAKNLASNVVADDGSIAIRIVKSGFCHQLLLAFGKPMVSTSANISGEATPILFHQISQEIKESVDHIVDEHFDTIHDIKPSQIIKLNANGEFRIIRK